MFFKLINTLKININLKKKIMRLKLNKNELILIKLLIKLNIIKFTKKLNNNIYDVFLNYNCNFKNIKNLYKPSRKFFLSYNELKKITLKKNWILILSTNKGLLTNFELIKKKTSGILILKLFN